MRNRVDDVPRDVRGPRSPPAAVVEWETTLDQNGNRKEDQRREIPRSFLEETANERARDLASEVVEIEIGKAEKSRDDEDRRHEAPRKPRGSIVGANEHWSTIRRGTGT